ncbi:myb-like protein M isoform X2 [Monomorium pharaonis]|uniref:myb-like protein M isoform X2 n=1 Tax=Monomorium pharaonis TaxID=307658 RepID=UPI001746E680|nr:myb-like protein M isoform X2 [Monomorium pharaonis]
MTAMFSNSNSEELTDASSQSSDNEFNFSTDNENNVETKKGSQKNEQSARKKQENQEETLKPSSEQQLKHHGNNNFNSPGCSTQTVQNNYDQGDDVMRTSNNHSVYDFNSGTVVETSNYVYIPPPVSSNYEYYDSSSTSGMYTNAANVSSIYTQELNTSGKIFLHTMD